MGLRDKITKHLEDNARAPTCFNWSCLMYMYEKAFSHLKDSEKHLNVNCAVFTPLNWILADELNADITGYADNEYLRPFLERQRRMRGNRLGPSNLHFSSEFDYEAYNSVTAFFAFRYDDAEFFLEQMYEMLKPGGMLIVVDYDLRYCADDIEYFRSVFDADVEKRLLEDDEIMTHKRYTSYCLRAMLHDGEIAGFDVKHKEVAGNKFFLYIAKKI